MNSLKALEILRENVRVSNDCILMVDEMYLEKDTQYSVVASMLKLTMKKIIIKA